MAISTKTIKRRLKSIGSTKKITKAMEMISAVKMRRAVNNVLATRSYARLAWEMLHDIGQSTMPQAHPLLERRPVKNVAVVLITSNRGLAGGFVSRLLQETDRFLHATHPGAPCQVILTGKRGWGIARRFGYPVIADYEKIDLTTKIEEVLPLARQVIAGFRTGTYDCVYLAYTDFVSALKQTPRIKPLLPLQTNEDRFLGFTREEFASSPEVALTEEAFTDETGLLAESLFTFEPEPRAVLDILLPRLVEMQLYQAVLESDASEHSARMMAMKGASDAAEEIIKELEYNYNKARQAGITREISEIVGGVAALE